MKRFLLWLSLLLAISLFAYPSVDLYYKDKQDREAMISMVNLVNDYSAIYATYSDEDKSVIKDNSIIEDFDTYSYTLNDPLGFIQIAKIDLTLPVIEGATEENMKNAATHIATTAKFGSVGNVAIAAHRARKEGRLFNRLNEVTFGDTIELIDIERNVYNYEVYSVNIVKPEDVYVLDSNNVDSILTLVTCVYIGKETDRLIIQARLVE